MNNKDIVDYENGKMDWDRMVIFFQRLIDTGLAWKLQGYGRTALEMAKEGFCTLPEGSPHAKRLEREISQEEQNEV